MRSAFIRCHCGAATGARRDLLLPVCRGSRFVVPGLSGLTRVRLQADPFGGDSECKTHWLVALFTTVQFCPSATMDVPVLANEVLSTTLLGQLATFQCKTAFSGEANLHIGGGPLALSSEFLAHLAGRSRRRPMLVVRPANVPCL